MNNKSETEIMKLMRGSFPRFPIFDVFRDFVSWVTLSIRQPLEWQNAEGIESRMRELCQKYNKKERLVMTEMYALLVEAMERAAQFGEYTDILSRIFQGLEIHSKTAGQFFTPWQIAYVSAKTAFRSKNVKEIIGEQGYITAYEPTVGGGTMILALAQVMKEAGFSPQKELLIYATDIDYRCACMTYIHTSLYCLPGVIQHGNELSQEIYGRWFTPIYVFDLWIFKDKFVRGKRERDETKAEPANAGGTSAVAPRTKDGVGEDKRGNPAVVEQLALPGLS